MQRPIHAHFQQSQNMFKSSQPYHRDLQSRGFVQGVTYTGTDLEPLCHYFGGIPYALPPVGLFRFHKPRPLPPDHQYGTRANPGNFTGGCGVCPQPGPAWNGDTSDSWDENCLQSNIWMPTGNPPAEGMHQLGNSLQ
jgi:carboxylesterase type B